MDTKTIQDSKANKDQRFLTFSVNNEEFAIPLLEVKEVIAKPTQITPVPTSPNYFVGIVNLRGEIISIIDLKTKLEIKNSSPSSSQSAVIIIELNNKSFGILVDQVNDVISTLKFTQDAKPQIISTKNTDYISSVLRKDNRLLLEIDICKALDVVDKKIIQRC
jgi:purine-binding chemotaxis protein CheW